MTPHVLAAVRAPGDTSRTGFDVERDFLEHAGLDLSGAQQAMARVATRTSRPRSW